MECNILWKLYFIFYFTVPNWLLKNKASVILNNEYLLLKLNA